MSERKPSMLENLILHDLAAWTEAKRAIEGARLPPCTCHPDDNPPRPCPRKYALSECRKAFLAQLPQSRKD